MILESDDGPDFICDVDEPTGAAMSKPEVLTPEQVSKLEEWSWAEGNLFSIKHEVRSLCHTIRELWEQRDADRKALKEILLYAIHGTGTKQKDARGRQFVAIVAAINKVAPEIADSAFAPPQAAEGERPCPTK